jgi:hypothetical protein
MSNNIDPYNPIFYAQEGLMVLEQALGMASRVYMGYDAERKSANRGDTIQIPKPGTFSTSAGGSATTADLTPSSIDLVVDTWRQVKFGLTDKELAFTSEKIIRDHISPAVYALALYIETTLTELYKDIPWSYNASSTPAAADIINTRKILRDNAGNLVDTDMVHFGIDSTMEAAFLAQEIFHAARITGEGMNEQALMNGSLGTRFGAEHFVQQTLASHTSGTAISNKADVAGTLNGGHSKGATTLTVQAFFVDSSSGKVDETLVAGDSLVIAGNTQRYAVTANATLAGGAASLTITPPLVQDYTTGSVVTLESVDSTNFADAYYVNMMFHRNAFAMAMAPLPDLGNNAGAKMAVVTDPRTGLSMRSRLGYDDDLATVKVTLDILYGVKTLDPNLAVICRRNY